MPISRGGGGWGPPAAAAPSGGGGGGGNDGTAPSYISALADYEVKRLATATNGKVNLNDTMPVAWQGITGDPTYGSNFNITAAYSGGAADALGAKAFINGGGHGDSGNPGFWEYDFNGTTEPEGWSLLAISPTPGSMSANTDPTSTSPDIPVSVHTYNGLVHDPDTNKVFRFAGGQWNSGAMPSKNWAFDVSAGTWAQTQNTPYAAENPVVSIIDDVKRKILNIAHSGVGWFYRIDTNAAGNNISQEQQNFDSVGTYDPTRYRAYLWAPSQLWELQIDWDAETVTMGQVTPTGSTGFLSSSTGAAFYDHDSDVHWFFPLVAGSTSMTTVVSMTPGLVCTSHSTSGDNTGFDTDNWEGSFNKICPMLQWRAVGFITGISDPAYVIKLPIL